MGSTLRTWSRRAALGLGAASGVAVLGTGGAWAWYAAPRPAAWAGLPPFLTPQADFYDRFGGKRHELGYWLGWWRRPLHELRKGRRPRSGPWRLRIDGQVRTPLDLDEAALLAARDRIGSVSYIKTLMCTGDGPWSRLMSNGVWTGVPLSALLEQAGLEPGALRLHITSEDGFTASVRLGELDGADGRPALLATGLQGEPLREERGGPCRLVVPDRFGFKNVKWVRRIEAVTEDETWGDHEVGGAGPDDGRVQMVGKFLSPDIRVARPRAEGRAGLLVLQGLAFGGQGTVAAVELRADGGPWQAAELPRPPELDSPVVRGAPGLVLPDRWPLRDVWVPWRIELELGSGVHHVAARIRLDGGAEQPEHDDEYIDGESSWAWAELHLA